MGEWKVLEAELKAPLSGLEPETVQARAEALGFCPLRTLRETDTYYQGVDRDFQQTDEALRLRRCRLLPDGPEENLLTYKGPKLDAVSSARMEYETAVADSEAARSILEALGHSPAFTVDKVRQEYRLEDITLCLDEVTGLGSFLELETLAPDETARAAAVDRLLEMLDRLGIARMRLTQRSYLELLATGMG